MKYLRMLNKAKRIGGRMRAIVAGLMAGVWILVAVIIFSINPIIGAIFIALGLRAMR